MLRPVKNRHIRPRVMGYVLSNAGTPSVSDGCKDDVSSVTDNSVGNSTINFFDIFQRRPVALVTPAGGTGAIGSVVTSAAGSVRVLTSAEDGTATDMNAHVMVFGWDSASTDSIAPNYALCRAGRFKPVLIGVSWSSAGTLLSGKYRGTMTGPSSSVYTLTLKDPFATAPVVVGAITGATAGTLKVASAVNTVTFSTFNAAGVATDNGGMALILGWYSKEYGRSHRVELQSPQLKPRLSVYEVTITGGVPAITIGGGSISDDGAGLFTITHPIAFKRAPEVVPTADGSNIANTVSSTTTATQIKTFSNAGVAADVGVVYVACLGYDDATEF